MVGNRRQGWALYGAMMVVLIVVHRDHLRGRVQPDAGDGCRGHHGRQHGGQGAALRHPRRPRCGRWSRPPRPTASVNGAMESLSGIGGAVPMALMQMGEVIFGGVGSGLYGMLLFGILAVFISGLMVGRTPEFLGKKIEAREVKLTVIGDDRRADARARRHRAGDDPLGQGLDVQLGAAGLLRGAVRLHVAGQQQRLRVRRLHRLRPARRRRAIRHHVRHRARRPRDDRRAASCRCSPCSPSPARSSARRVHPPSVGTFRTDSPTFVVVLVAIVLIVALLTFVPALLLGPVVQGMTDQLF